LIAVQSQLRLCLLYRLFYCRSCYLNPFHSPISF
jgi:hypothetical protein